MKLHAALLLAALLPLTAPLRAGPAPAPTRASGDHRPVTVFLLRHAEAADGRDPELSSAGRERTRVLSRLLGEAGITHLYSSEARRARDTLAPLAEQLGLQVEAIPAAQAKRQVAGLLALPPGSVAVVAGHSNTVPRMVEALGGQASELEDHPPHGRIFPHDAYDRLIQVILPRSAKVSPPAEGDPPDVAGSVVTIELRYGD